jgi:hypothetical protein
MKDTICNRRLVVQGRRTFLASNQSETHGKFRLRGRKLPLLGRGGAAKIPVSDFFGVEVFMDSVCKVVVHLAANSERRSKSWHRASIRPKPSKLDGPSSRKERRAPTG